MGRFAFLSFIAFLAIAAAACGNSDNVRSPATVTSSATPTPLEQSRASVIVVGREELSIDEYSQRLVELDVRTSATSAGLRDQVANGLLPIEGAIAADFENIGDFVIGLYALHPPRELFTNHERRVQSLMAYVVAFQDRRHLLEEAGQRDADVCEETERLAANYGITIDLECDLGDW